MPSAKLSVSMTPELAICVRALAASRSEDTSRLIETLLREHPLVRQGIEEARAGGAGGPGAKKGRDVEKATRPAELPTAGRARATRRERRAPEDRKILFFAPLNDHLPKGYRAVLVGGTPVEFYTQGQY